MTVQMFENFCKIKNSFKQQIDNWTMALPELMPALNKLAELTGENNYKIETPIVYNKSMDDINASSQISWIIIADNPGKKEQEAARQRYLTGTSGKMAEGFFNRELAVDFRKNTIIINKTPIHSPKTTQLRKLIHIYPEIKKIMEESQRFMAAMVPSLQRCFNAKVWVMGLSELRPKGLFEPWLQELKNLYTFTENILDKDLYFFNHFSMGSFSTDLARRKLEPETVQQAVLRIGKENCLRIMNRL